MGEIMDETLDMLKARMTALEELLGLHHEDERLLLNTQRDNAISLIGKIEDVLGIEYNRSALSRRKEEFIVRKAKLA
jgi:hypothetical protein